MVGLKNGCIFAPVFDRTRSLKRKNFDTDEKIEIACVGRLLGEARDTRRVKKVKLETSNSYNEEFDPGSG